MDDDHDHDHDHDDDDDDDDNDNVITICVVYSQKRALQDLIIVSLSIYLAALIPATLMFLGSRMVI